MGGFVGCLSCHPTPLSPREPNNILPGREKCGPGKGWTVNVASFPPGLFLPNRESSKAKPIWPGVSQSLAKN